MAGSPTYHATGCSRWRNRVTPIEYQRPPRGASISRRLSSAAMAALDNDRREPFRHARGALCYPSAMFFERWRVWAVRVVGRVCEDIRSEEATLAIDLIVRAARRAPSGLPKRDAVIIAAIYMPENQAAVSKVAQGLDVNPRAAEMFLDRVRREAIEVAEEEGLQKIAERGRRVRMRYLAGP